MVRNITSWQPLFDINMRNSYTDYIHVKANETTFSITCHAISKMCVCVCVCARARVCVCVCM